MQIAVKRVYEPVSRKDGFRVLVDGLWPRGISKANAHIDLWLRDIAPSTALRRWFDHDPARWKSFSAKYRNELRKTPHLLVELKQRARLGPLTLLYSAREERFNQAVVLCGILKKPLTRISSRHRTRS
jgi:uncharacterized protein YeaO (DUF488 family)